MKLSEKIKKISPSKTLAITQKAKDMKKSGIDVVGFGAGEPDFDTPEHIREAAKTAIDEGFTRYTPVPGIPELREALSDNILKNTGVKYGLDQIITTCGAKAALFLAFQVLTNPGDEVIIPAPYWVSYPEQVKLAGAEPNFLEAREENGFKIKPDDLEKIITEKSKLLILNSPSNPTGAVYTGDELHKIFEICIPKNITILADEIYDKLTFDSNFCPALKAHPKAAEYTIYINGVSKGYAMTGWRMGYAAGPAEVISAMCKYQSQLYTNITTFVQKAVITALGTPDDVINGMRDKFKARRDLALEIMKDIPGIKCVVPDGAFYLYPNVSEYFGKKYNGGSVNSSEDLAKFFLEEAHVAVVPGTAFGTEGYIRLSYALSDKEIEKGLNRIKEALTKLE